MFFNAKLEERVKALESSNAILAQALLDTIERMDKLQLELRDVTLAYMDHLYNYYHGLKTPTSAAIEFYHPHLSYTEELNLIKARQELKRRNDLGSASKFDESSTEE